MENIIKKLKLGAVGILPTDTLYGLVGSALDKEVVEKIYDIRHRRSEKPFIVLIGDLVDLEKIDNLAIF